MLKEETFSENSSDFNYYLGFLVAEFFELDQGIKMSINVVETYKKYVKIYFKTFLICKNAIDLEGYWHSLPFGVVSKLKLLNIQKGN